MRKELSLPTKLLSSNYPFLIDEISLVRIKRGRGVWKVKTDAGTMYFKKIPRKEPMVQFIIQAVNFLSERGIKFPAIYKTKDNEMYVKHGEDCYLLMEEIIGTIPDYKNPEEVESVVKELATLHRASLGFCPYQEGLAKNKVNKWVRTLSRNRLLTDTVLKGKSTLISRDLSKEELGQLERCKARILEERFTEEGSFYLKWAENNHKNGGLCHYDFNRWNLRITPGGDIYLLDFDTLAIDLPIADLKSFLYSFLRIEKEAGAKHFYQLLSWYQQVNPLSEEEWMLVKEWLYYPHHIVNLCKRYQRDIKPRLVEKQFRMELKQLLEVEMLLEKVLKNFDHAISQIIKK